MKYLVVVNSATNVSSDLVLHNYKRSFYSNEERFSQTVETLKNIRRTIPNAMVIFAEGTGLYPNQIIEYRKYADIFLECDDNPEVKIAVSGKSKSIGESVTMWTAVNFIIENKIEFDMMFKICARNQFDSNFICEKFNDRTKFYFRMFKNSYNEWYVTSMYGIGRECLTVYKETLEKVIPLLVQGNCCDIESGLCRYIDTSKVVKYDVIGVVGTLGGHGTPFSH